MPERLVSRRWERRDGHQVRSLRTKAGGHKCGIVASNEAFQFCPTVARVYLLCCTRLRPPRVRAVIGFPSPSPLCPFPGPFLINRFRIHVHDSYCVRSDSLRVLESPTSGFLSQCNLRMLFGVSRWGHSIQTADMAPVTFKQEVNKCMSRR